MEPHHSASEEENELRRVKEQLAMSERRSRLIVDSIPQIIWENDPDGKAIYFNQRWFDYCGLSQAESEGPGWPVLIHPEDAGAVEEWWRCLRQGEPFSAQGRLRRRDGIYEWHLLRNNPGRNDQGEIVGWFGTATNINQLITTTTMLEQVTERFRAVLEAARDYAIVTLDVDGYIVDWNSGSERLFGYSREEAVGQYTDLIFTDEDKYANMAGLEITKARDTGQCLDERWHVRKDGSKFFMSGVMTPIRNSSFGGYVKVARDITERKLAEEALMLAEQRSNTAIQSTRMGQWTWDILEDVVERNEYMQQLMGIGRPEMEDASFFAYMYPEDLASVREQVQTAIDGLNIFQAEFRILRADSKQVRWVSAYGRIVRRVDNQAQRMTGVMYDITARKILEKQKDDFISVASHELKTPVTSIKGYSQILLHNFTEANDLPSIDLTVKLNGQVDRLNKLLYTLLDSTSLLEGRLRLKPERFDLNELLEEQIAELRPLSQKHELVWRPGRIPLIHADKGRIRQVIANLITNAIKYSREGQAIISSEDALDGVVVTVRDFGPGIPPDQQKEIFKRYYRIDQSSSNSQSLGLGLYISLEIIKEHKGTMGVDSILGEGSSFYFKLPYS